MLPTEHLKEFFQTSFEDEDFNELLSAMGIDPDEAEEIINALFDSGAESLGEKDGDDYAMTIRDVKILMLGSFAFGGYLTLKSLVEEVKNV